MSNVNETVSSIHNGDDTFYEFICKAFDRIENPDIDDPEFFAIASSIDYRLKHLSTRGDAGERESMRIMELCRRKGFVPQHQLSGIPATELGRIHLSPDGKLCINNGPYSGIRIDLFLTGEMRPICTIVPSDPPEECVFSPDSRSLAILTTGGLEIWDLEALKVTHSFTFGEDYESHGIKWSGNGRRLFFNRGMEFHVLEIDKGVIDTVGEDFYGYIPDYEGNRLLQNDHGVFFLYDFENGSVKRIDIPLGEGCDPFIIDSPSGFQVFDKGLRFTVTPEGEVLGPFTAAYMDNRDADRHGLRPEVEWTSMASYEDGLAVFIVSDGIDRIEYTTDLEGNIVSSYRASRKVEYAIPPEVKDFNPRTELLSFQPRQDESGTFAFLMGSEVILFRPLRDQQGFAYRVLKVDGPEMEASFIDPSLFPGFTDIPDPQPGMLKHRYKSIESRFKDLHGPMDFYETMDPVSFEADWLRLWRDAKSYTKGDFTVIQSDRLLFSHPGLRRVMDLDDSEKVHDLFRSDDGDFVITSIGRTFRMHLLIEDGPVHLGECGRRADATLVGDRIILADGNRFEILDAKGTSLWRTEPLSERPWIPINTDSFGNLCMFRTSVDVGYEKHAHDVELEFATLRHPDYTIHQYEGEGFSVHVDDFTSRDVMSLDFNGRDIIVSDLPSGGRHSLTSYRVEKSGIRRRKTILCDPLRIKPTLIHLNDGTYLTSVNVPSELGNRAMIRLMDPSSGRRETYSSDAPEGQMQGPPGFSLEGDCRVESLDGMVVMELNDGEKTIIVSMDPSTGKLYPRNPKPIFGRISDVTDGKVEVLMGRDLFDSVGLFDNRMNLVERTPLDAPFNRHGHRMDRPLPDALKTISNSGMHQQCSMNVVDVVVSLDLESARDVEPTLTPWNGWKGRRPVEVLATAHILRNGRLVSNTRFNLELALPVDGDFSKIVYEFYAVPFGDGFAIIQFQDTDPVTRDPLYQMRIISDAGEETVYGIVGFEHSRNPVTISGRDVVYVIRQGDGYAIRTPRGDIAVGEERPTVCGYGDGATIYHTGERLRVNVHADGSIHTMFNIDYPHYSYLGTFHGVRVFESPMSRRMADYLHVPFDGSSPHVSDDLPRSNDSIETGGYSVTVKAGIGLAFPLKN